MWAHIGHASVLQSMINGAGQIIVIGAQASRLALAKNLGASYLISLDEARAPNERIKKVREMSNERGADVVIEASGGSTAFQEGVEMSRIGGKYLVIGQATDYGTKEVNPYYITRNQLQVFGSWATLPRLLLKAIKSLQGVDLPLEKLITYRFRFEEATKGLEAAERFESVIGVIDFEDD